MNAFYESVLWLISLGNPSDATDFPRSCIAQARPLRLLRGEEFGALDAHGARL